MANIPSYPLIPSVLDTTLVPVDSGIQTFRATGKQLKDYAIGDLEPVIQQLKQDFYLQGLFGLKSKSAAMKDNLSADPALTKAFVGGTTSNPAPAIYGQSATRSFIYYRTSNDWQAAWARQDLPQNGNYGNINFRDIVTGTWCRIGEQYCLRSGTGLTAWSAVSLPTTSSWAVGGSSDTGKSIAITWDNTDANGWAVSTNGGGVWTKSGRPAWIGQPSKLLWANGVWVMINQETISYTYELWYSTDDALTWTQATLPSLGTQAFTELYNFNGRWVILNSSSSIINPGEQLLWSDDAITWHKSTTFAEGNAGAKSILYHSQTGLYIAHWQNFSDSFVRFSKDLDVWTTVDMYLPQYLQGLTWANGTFAAHTGYDAPSPWFIWEAPPNQNIILPGI